MGNSDKKYLELTIEFPFKTKFLNFVLILMFYCIFHMFSSNFGNDGYLVYHSRCITSKE